MSVKRLAGVAAALAVSGWLTATGSAGADPLTPSPAPPAPKTTIDTDGTFKVGVDIAPGAYASAGPLDGGTCYWRRSSADGDTTIDNALSKQPQVVLIDPTDGAFKTNGCQPWLPTDPASVPSPPVMGPLAGLLARAQLGGYLNQINAGAAAAPPPDQPVPGPDATAPPPP